MALWNFSTARVELQASLKQLTIALSNENQQAKAREAVDMFVSHFFEHTLDGEQTDLVADALQGMRGVLAERVSPLIRPSLEALD